MATPVCVRLVGSTRIGWASTIAAMWITVSVGLWLEIRNQSWSVGTLMAIVAVVVASTIISTVAFKIIRHRFVAIGEIPSTWWDVELVLLDMGLPGVLTQLWRAGAVISYTGIGFVAVAIHVTSGHGASFDQFRYAGTLWLYVYLPLGLLVLFIACKRGRWMLAGWMWSAWWINSLILLPWLGRLAWLRDGEPPVVLDIFPSRGTHYGDFRHDIELFVADFDRPWTVLLFPLMLLFAIFCFGLAWHCIWVRGRRHTKYCRKCDYNLTGLTVNRCLECGVPFHAPWPRLAGDAIAD